MTMIAIPVGWVRNEVRAAAAATTSNVTTSPRTTATPPSSAMPVRAVPEYRVGGSTGWATIRSTSWTPQQA
jgi:hypothetical protein